MRSLAGPEPRDRITRELEACRCTSLSLRRSGLAVLVLAQGPSSWEVSKGGDLAEHGGYATDMCSQLLLVILFLLTLISFVLPSCV